MKLRMKFKQNCVDQKIIADKKEIKGHFSFLIRDTRVHLRIDFITFVQYM